MMILSFTFSLRLRFVTVMCTVAPVGIAEPFVPLIASVVKAVMLSPTLLVLVQTSADDASASVVPEAIVPVRAAGAGVVAVFVGVVEVFGVVFAVVFGVVLFTTGGALVVELFAVSPSVSVALSLFASAMFAASAESFFSAVESVFDESPEQAASVTASARDAAVI